MAKRPTKKAAGPTRRRNNRPQTPFPFKLALNQWLLSLFNVAKFEELAEHLRNEALESLDENRVHRFHHALTSQFFNLTELPTEQLFEYDQNIVKHTLRLNERRIAHGEESIAWKYFQYLALLATEIYLDRYFRDPAALVKELNAQIARFGRSTWKSRCGSSWAAASPKRWPRATLPTAAFSAARSCTCCGT